MDSILLSIDPREPLWIAFAFGCGILISRIGLPPMIGFLIAGFLLNASGAEGGHFRPETPLRSMLEAVERDLIERALRHREGHVTKTAADLGLERSHLYKKMRALGIRRPGDD